VSQLIKNNEFKKIRFYKEMIDASEKRNFFDQYSIIRALGRNIVRGKDFLFSQMSFDDEDSLQDLFDQLEGIEITGDDSFNLGNPKTNVWLEFIVNDDGTFTYRGSRSPIPYGSGRKYC